MNEISQHLVIEVEEREAGLTSVTAEGVLSPAICIDRERVRNCESEGTKAEAFRSDFSKIFASLLVNFSEKGLRRGLSLCGSSEGHCDFGCQVRTRRKIPMKQFRIPQVLSTIDSLFPRFTSSPNLL